jgi:hypothetical protein
MRAKPWDVPDELWERIEPLLPAKPRRLRHPDRKLTGSTVKRGLLGPGPQPRVARRPCPFVPT